MLDLLPYGPDSGSIPRNSVPKRYRGPDAVVLRRTKIQNNGWRTVWHGTMPSCAPEILTEGMKYHLIKNDSSGMRIVKAPDSHSHPPTNFAREISFSNIDAWKAFFSITETVRNLLAINTINNTEMAVQKATFL